MAFQRVARADDIPDGRGLCVRIGDLEIGLFSSGRRGPRHGKTAAHTATSHSAKACSRGAIITCAAHGWDFDVRTGFKPDDADGWPLPCFQVRVEGGDVLVDPEQVINIKTRRR